MRSFLLFQFNKMSNKGFTLIEVLVALFILSTGILGAVAMQASAKKGSFDAMQRSMASSLAQDIVERMRGNDTDPTNGILNGYNGSAYGLGELVHLSDNQRCNSSATLCTSEQLRTNDLYEWELSLRGANVRNGNVNNGGLVGVVGCINHSNGNVTIAISWEGREETSDGATNNVGFGQNCGSSTISTNKRRQITINAFIH